MKMLFGSYRSRRAIFDPAIELLAVSIEILLRISRLCF